MTEINLLEHINLSYSEIYQIEHGEVEQGPDSTDKKSLVGLKSPTTLMFAGIGLLLTLAAAAVVYFGFIQTDTPSDNATAMMAKDNQTDNGTDNQQLGFSKKFVKVGSITFKEKEKKAVETPPKKENKPNPIKKKPIKTKPVEKKKTVEKKIEMPKVKTITLSDSAKPKPVKKNQIQKPSAPHYALFEDISRQQLIQLKKKVKIAGLSYSVNKTKEREHTLWELYRQDPKGKKVIADRKVIFIKNFKTKDAAVQYAKKHHINAIIMTKKIKERYYFINIYPFKSQKDAINFSKRSAFPKKSVKIIKGQP